MWRFDAMLSNLLKAIDKQAKELGWIEEEKQEIKQETNFEHYKDRILDCCIVPDVNNSDSCNVVDSLLNEIWDAAWSKECVEVEYLKSTYVKEKIAK